MDVVAYVGTLEITIGEAQAGDRAAEAHVTGALEIEARLERQAAQRGAIAIATGPQRAGRQHHEAARTVAADLDVARDRSVGEDAAIAGGAVKAGVGKMLAGDEALRLVG